MPAYTTETRETGGRRDVAVTILFVLLAAVLNYLPAEAQQRVASALRSTVLRPFVTTQEGLAEARIRATESQRLRERLDSMVSAATAHATLEEENRRLRGLLSLSRRLGPRFRASVVVRPGTAGSESMFLVDAGASAGVQAPAAVITRQGLLGVVRDVQETSSMGMDWTHPDFRASAMTFDGSTTGIVESHRGDFREEDRLVLNGTAFHTTLDEGTVVVTSGLGAVYPRGIPIGRVRSLAEADAGWRKSYWLEPFVEPGTARHVLVAVGRGDSLPGLADLSSAWPRDSITTSEELVRIEETRRDSLAAVEDSLGLLRAILGAGARQDSLRTTVLADSSAPLPRPAPPTATSGGGGTPAAAPAPDTSGRATPRTVPTPSAPADTAGIRPNTATVDTTGTDTTDTDTTGTDTTGTDTTDTDTTGTDTTGTDTTGTDTTGADTTTARRSDRGRASGAEGAGG